MNPDFRYHVATLSAVFLALGIGILIGTGFVGTKVVDRQTAAVNRLTRETIELRKETQEREQTEQTLQAALPFLLKNTLAGKSVLVVQIRAREAADQAQKALELAGAHVEREPPPDELDTFLAQPHPNLVVLAGGATEERAQSADRELIERLKSERHRVVAVELFEVATPLTPLWGQVADATVDCMNRATGWLALVVALKGESGRFGLKSGTQLVPLAPLTPALAHPHSPSRARAVSLTVVIPAYNEADRIAATVSAALSLEGVMEVLVIDDGSTDTTARVAEEAGARVVRQAQNQGKAAALTAGLAAAKTPYLLLLDGDLGATATEAACLIPPVLSGETDMTIATFPVIPGRGGGMGLVVRLSRWGVHRATGTTLTAPLSGQRCLRREVLEAALPLARGFGIETGLNIAALRAGFRVRELATTMDHRVTQNDWRGRLHRARQLRDVALALLRYRR